MVPIDSMAHQGISPFLGPMDRRAKAVGIQSASKALSPPLQRGVGCFPVPAANHDEAG